MLERLDHAAVIGEPNGAVIPGEVMSTLATRKLCVALGATCNFADRTPTNGGGKVETPTTGENRPGGVSARPGSAEDHVKELNKRFDNNSKG